MKNPPIGGFFELELPSKKMVGYHPKALALTNGRACMTWILENEQPSKVFLPYYCCRALYEPMVAKGIACEFYNIDSKLNPIDLTTPEEGELLVYINFFGLKNRECEELSGVLGRKLVVDDTHRFFHHGYEGAYSFTSARKYFGVPDGAYLYPPDESLADDIPRFDRPSLQHGLKRLIGDQDAAFRAFQRYENSLGIEVFRISEISERLLGGVDYEFAKTRRRENFEFLHKKLQSLNRLDVNMCLVDIPFCYPFLPSKKIDKSNFYASNIFVPTLWPDILERNDPDYILECELTEQLLPLPVDQRYSHEEMNRIIELTNNLIENE